MSFRLLQVSGTALLLLVMLAMGALAYQYSRSMADYLNLIVGLHTPVLDSFTEIKQYLSVADSNIRIYQNQDALNTNELKYINNRLEKEVKFIASFYSSAELRTILPRIESDMKNLDNGFRGGEEVSVISSYIDSIESDLFSLSNILNKIYQKSDKNIKNKIMPHLLVITNISDSMRNLLGKYTGIHYINHNQVVAPLSNIRVEVNKIKSLLVDSNHSHIGDTRSLIKNSLDDDHAQIYFRKDDSVVVDLDTILALSQRLHQSIHIYAEEKIRMDPSASQVANTLAMVNQLIQRLKIHVNKTHNSYRDHVSHDQDNLINNSESKQQDFILFILLGFITGVVGVVAINRIVSRDIEKMITGTQLFSHSDLDYRIKGTKLKEFIALASDFNDMADNVSRKDRKLRESIDDLDKAHSEVLDAKSDLEHKVKERTSELMIAMEDAKKSDRAKSAFLANMSHELRTPLHGILSFSRFGMKKTGTITDEKIKKYFTQIDSSGTRLKVLLDDLLDLSKLEAGKMRLSLSHVSLQGVIEDCVAEQEALLMAQKITVIYDYKSDIPMIHCDKNRIGQVVMNLLSNAIKFSPDGGHINISGALVKSDDDSSSEFNAVEISISDQGAGIPENELESVFNKFTQSESIEYSSGGTGLGLAISRELINIHHGKIWCKNSILGGAVFYFVIPVKQVEA